MKGTTSRVAALGMAAAFVVAGATAATAQVPGVNPRTQIFPVNDSRIEIDVKSADLAAGTVGVTIQNNNAGNVTCTGIGTPAGPAGTVTTAEVVAKSVEFYRTYPESDIADLILTLSPGGAQTIPLGSVEAQVGSLADYMYPEWSAMNMVSEAFSAARLAGQYGMINGGGNIAIPNDQAIDIVVPLDQQSAGAREDFQTGVFMTCVLGGQRYVFGAYEGGIAPNPNTPPSTGSLGSDAIGSTGSAGSYDGTNGSASSGS